MIIYHWYSCTIAYCDDCIVHKSLRCVHIACMLHVLPGTFCGTVCAHYYDWFMASDINILT